MSEWKVDGSLLDYQFPAESRLSEGLTLAKVMHCAKSNKWRFGLSDGSYSDFDGDNCYEDYDTLMLKRRKFAPKYVSFFCRAQDSCYSLCEIDFENRCRTTKEANKIGNALEDH